MRNVIIKEIELSKLSLASVLMDEWEVRRSIIPKICCVSNKWVWMQPTYRNKILCSVSNDETVIGNILLSSESYVLYKLHIG